MRAVGFIRIALVGQIEFVSPTMAGHDEVKQSKKEAAELLVKEAQPMFQAIGLDDKQIE